MPEELDGCPTQLVSLRPVQHLLLPKPGNDARTVCPVPLRGKRAYAVKLGQNNDVEFRNCTQDLHQHWY